MVLRVRSWIRFLLLASALASACWLFSPYRRIEIEKYRTSCQPIPFWFFSFGHRLLSAGELSLPAATSFSGRVSMLQTCSVPYANSPALKQLLKSHRDYAQRSGRRYEVATGGRGDVWDKIRSLRSHLERELSVNQTSNEWIL